MAQLKKTKIKKTTTKSNIKVKAKVKKNNSLKKTKGLMKPKKTSKAKKTLTTVKLSKSKSSTKSKSAQASTNQGSTKLSKQLKVGAKKNPITLKTPSIQKKITKPTSKAWLHPLDDRLLIEIVDPPKTTPGGLILIDSSEQTENMQGFVLAVGRGHQNKKGRIRPVEAKIGDKIIFSKFAGDKISRDGVNFVVIRETDVLGFASI